MVVYNGIGTCGQVLRKPGLSHATLVSRSTAGWDIKAHEGTFYGVMVHCVALWYSAWHCGAARCKRWVKREGKVEHWSMQYGVLWCRVLWCSTAIGPVSGGVC